VMSVDVFGLESFFDVVGVDGVWFLVVGAILCWTHGHRYKFDLCDREFPNIFQSEEQNGNRLTSDLLFR
jgi:hypothetical protein